jgi:hypothetical protein
MLLCSTGVMHRLRAFADAALQHADLISFLFEADGAPRYKLCVNRRPKLTPRDLG